MGKLYPSPKINFKEEYQKDQEKGKNAPGESTGAPRVYCHVLQVCQTMLQRAPVCEAHPPTRGARAPLGEKQLFAIFLYRFEGKGQLFAVFLLQKP